MKREVTAGDAIYIALRKVHILTQSGVKPLRFITVSIDLSEAAEREVDPTYVA